MGDSNLLAPIKNGGGGLGWSTAGEKVISNSPRTLPNFNWCININKDNTCCCIPTPDPVNTLDNEMYVNFIIEPENIFIKSLVSKLST